MIVIMYRLTTITVRVVSVGTIGIKIDFNGKIRQIFDNKRSRSTDSIIIQNLVDDIDRYR